MQAARLRVSGRLLDGHRNQRRGETRMRRMLIAFVLFVGALTLAASGFADPGDKGKGKKQGKNRFTFTLTNTDNRCDGSGAWANLNEKRTYAVHDNGDGTFTLRRISRGTFTRSRVRARVTARPTRASTATSSAPA